MVDEFVLRSALAKSFSHDEIARIVKLVNCPEQTTQPGSTSLRPELLEFADAMEAILRKNDHKNTTGWKRMPVPALFRLLKLEVGEAEVAVEFFNADQVRHELVDIANFCLILYNRLGILNQTQPIGTHRCDAKDGYPCTVCGKYEG